MKNKLPFKPITNVKAQFQVSFFSILLHQVNHNNHFTSSFIQLLEAIFSILRTLSIPAAATPSYPSLKNLSWWWMAKNNKYTSINFNHIYDKTTSSSSNNTTTPKTTNQTSLSSLSPSSASYSAVSAPNKPHGRILVLTRPSPKPVTPPTAPSPSKQPHPNQIQTHQDQPRSEPGSDSISLRPLGRTGAGPVLPGPTVAAHEKDRTDLPAPPLISPKPDKFVPPHLRPGYVPREEVPPGPDVGRGRDSGHRRAGHVGSPGPYGEDGRPKSGGYERMRRGGPGVGSDMGIMGRPRSSGSRPSSSG